MIGGLIWGGFGEVFAIPLDLTLGEGPWAHLPAADYVRTRDHYPAEPGVFRRGDGDWGIFDAWNRPRPEVWHVHGMYSPIRITADEAGAGGGRLDGGAREPVLAPVARGVGHPRVGRPGRGRRGRRAERAPGRDGSARRAPRAGRRGRPAGGLAPRGLAGRRGRMAVARGPHAARRRPRTRRRRASRSLGARARSA